MKKTKDTNKGKNVTTLKDARRSAKLTQEAASEEIGVSTNTVQNWERKNWLCPDDFKLISRVYGLSLEFQKRLVLGFYGLTLYEQGAPDLDLARKNAYALILATGFSYPLRREPYELLTNVMDVEEMPENLRTYFSRAATRFSDLHPGCSSLVEVYARRYGCDIDAAALLAAIMMLEGAKNPEAIIHEAIEVLCRVLDLDIKDYVARSN